MNGASAEPCANTSTVPTTTITTITGSSHHFLRWPMNPHSSPIRLIAPPLRLELPTQIAGATSFRPRFPIARFPIRVHERVAADRSAQRADWSQHQHIHHAHDAVSYTHLRAHATP